jgi:hypothetical protein
MEPVKCGVPSEFSKETKYFGVVLESTLLWDFQIKRVRDGNKSSIGVQEGDWLDIYLTPAMMGWITLRWQKSEHSTATQEYSRVLQLLR